MSKSHLEQDLFGDAAGLIPPEPERPLSGRGRSYGLATVFLALTFLPGLVDTFRPLQAVLPVGEEAQAEAERRQHLTWMDGSRGRWFEDQRKRRSRVRHWVLPTYSAAMLAGFGDVQDDLWLGKEDWLFLEARGVTPSVSDEQIVQRAVDLLTAVQSAASDSGRRLVLVPIPRKVSLAVSYLPDGVESRPELDELFASRLAKTQLDVVDLLPALRTLPERWNETAYYEGDSHLTCVAMLEMAETVAQHLEGWQPEAHRLGELVDLGSVPPRTDLLYLAGVDPSSRLGRDLTPEPRRCFAVRAPEGGALQRLVEPQETHRVGWVGTSFSAFSQVSVYLAHFLGEPVADYAAPGIHSLRELEQRLGRPQEAPLPEILVVEIPNYQLFDWNRHKGLWSLDVTPPAAAPADGRRPPELGPSPDASVP